MRIYPEEQAIRSIVKRIEVDENGCWVWTHFLTAHGYARTSLGEGDRRWSRGEIVHRWMYDHYIGSIPKGWLVHHRCGNKACINPEHLEALSRKEHGKRHRS